MTIKPTSVSRPARRAIGISARTSNAAEIKGPAGKIAALWQRFMADDVAAKVGGGGSVVGVYSDYESDHEGEYNLTVGVEVDEACVIPEGMVEVRVPAGNFLRFEKDGSIPAVVIESWQGIWTHFQAEPEPKRLYGVDMEIYSKGGVVIEIQI